MDYFSFRLSHNAVRIKDLGPAINMSSFDSLIAEGIAYEQMRFGEGDVAVDSSSTQTKLDMYREGILNKRVEFLQVLDTLSMKGDCEDMIEMLGTEPEGGWTRGAIMSAIISFDDEALADRRCEIKDVKAALEYAKEYPYADEAAIDAYADFYEREQGFERKPRVAEDTTLSPEQAKVKTAEELRDLTQLNKAQTARRGQEQKALEARYKQRAKSRSLSQAEKDIFKGEYDRIRKENKKINKMTKFIMSAEKRRLAQQYKYENDLLSDRARKNYEKNAAKLIDTSITLRMYAARHVKQTEAMLGICERDSDLAKMSIARAEQLKKLSISPRAEREEKEAAQKREAEQRKEEMPFVRRADDATRQKSKEIKEYMREQRREREEKTKQAASPVKQKTEPTRTAEPKTRGDDLGL